MQESGPLVSICLATYNHERYIDECISSILGQDYQNIEVIVVNDGSQDRTLERLQKIKDPRLKVITQENQGPSAAMNRAMKESRGEYIATFSGDDVFCSDRITTSLSFLKNNDYDLIFSVPIVINENGQEYDEHEFPTFSGKSFLNSAEMLRQLFDHSNFICASTSLGKAELYRNGSGFNESSLQLQDFEKWIELGKKYKVGLMQERVTKYRFESQNSNLSGTKNEVRTYFELLMVYDRFFEGMSISLLKEAFGARVSSDLKEWSDQANIDVAFLFYKHPRKELKYLGLKRLYELYQKESARNILKEKYNFRSKDLYQAMNDVDFMNRNLYRDVSCAGILGRISIHILVSCKTFLSKWKRKI